MSKDSANSSNNIILIFAVIAIVVSTISMVFSMNNKKGEGSSLNEKDVENIVATWVERNPNFIVESITKEYQENSKKRNVDVKENLVLRKSDLFENRDDPRYEPSNSSAVVVKFFDYNCGYCKRSYNTIKALIAQDKNVTVVFKEFPVLGASSMDLARIAIAVNMINSDKYFEFHSKLMTTTTRAKEEVIKLASSILNVGVSNINKTLKNKASAINKILDNNHKLAQDLGITGTPTFVVGDELIVGAVGIETIKSAIDKTR